MCKHMKLIRKMRNELPLFSKCVKRGISFIFICFLKQRVFGPSCLGLCALGLCCCFGFCCWLLLLAAFAGSGAS